MNISHFVPEGGTQAVDSSPSHAHRFQADLRRDQRLCHLHVLQAQPVQQKNLVLISNTNSRKRLLACLISSQLDILACHI